MARRFDFLALLVLITLSSTWLTPRGQEVLWVDAMALWNPRNEEPGTAYRFSLPGNPNLAVTLVKQPGGNHNRFWELLIEQTDRPVPARRDSWKGMFEWESWPEVGQHLTHKDFLASNDTIFGPDPKPRIYYQSWKGSYRFLVYQPACDPRFGKQEGWSIWHPGQDWTACDRWATPRAGQT